MIQYMFVYETRLTGNIVSQRLNGKVFFLGAQVIRALGD